MATTRRCPVSSRNSLRRSSRTSTSAPRDGALARRSCRHRPGVPCGYRRVGGPRHRWVGHRGRRGRGPWLRHGDDPCAHVPRRLPAPDGTSWRRRAFSRKHPRRIRAGSRAPGCGGLRSMTFGCGGSGSTPALHRTYDGPSHANRGCRRGGCMQGRMRRTYRVVLAVQPAGRGVFRIPRARLPRPGARLDLAGRGLGVVDHSADRDGGGRARLRRSKNRMRFDYPEPLAPKRTTFRPSPSN